ncbi:hypothetical protein ACO0QE_001806 [Hanseniaspora vineae]
MSSTPLLQKRPSSYGTLHRIINNNNKAISATNLNASNNISSEDLTQRDEDIEWPYEDSEREISDSNNKDHSESPFSRAARFTRENSIISRIARRRGDTLTSIKEGYYKVVRYKHFKLFLSMFIGSLFFYIAFTLAFLPRTSLSRDFRRIHFSQQLTKPEIYRHYLDSIRQDNLFPELVRNFSASNNLIGDEILLQSTYTYLDSRLDVKPKLEQFDFKKDLYNTDNEISLYDSDSGNIIYKPSIKEPCFDSTSCDDNSLKSFVFSHIGHFSIEGHGIEVDMGSFDNYTRLSDLQGKIHILKLNNEISLISQIRNSISFGAIGCIVYNEKNADDVYYFQNNYISRNSIINDETDLAIPVISMSFNEMEPILKYIRTAESPEQYKLRLESKNYPVSQEVAQLNNIVVTIPGIWKSHEVIIGYNRDLFTYHGVNSGHLIFLELCRGLSALKQKGWKPLRTIKLISFDGDTYGNFGSKHYLKQHLNNEKSIVFIDIDKEAVAGNSTFSCRSSEMFNGLIKTAAKLTPYSKKSENDYDSDLFREFLEVDDSKRLNLQRLDANSRAQLFLSENGIPSISCGFTGPITFPHNSNYLSMELFEDLIDPNYKSHQVLSEFLGLLILTTAEREVIEYDLGKYFTEIKYVFDELIATHSFMDRSKEKYINKLDKLLEDLTIIFNSIDLYNARLQQQTSIDYPWYHLNTKLQLMFKIKSLNNKLIKIKQLFLKGTYEDTKHPKDIIMQPNKYTGNSIEVLGTLHELLEIHDKHNGSQQNIHEYLQTLYEKLSVIKEFTLDIYPYD